LIISVVVPVLDESESLPQLRRELAQAAQGQAWDYELLLIDDGSSDASWTVIQELAQTDHRVRGIRFRRNFGKASALQAGFDVATGELICTMDADLQDDPGELPKFVAMLHDEQLDVISGWKRVRHDPAHKVASSRVFNALVSWLTGVKLHDHNCGYKLYRREVFDEVRIYGELHRFVPVLAAARGFRVGEREVQHRARRFGRSKYGLKRVTRGLLDLLTVYFLTGYQQRPQHLLGTLGLGAFCLGVVGMCYLTVYWLAGRIWPDAGYLPLHQRPAVLYSLGAMLLGAQLLSLGFLAEMLTAQSQTSRRPYSIAATTDPEPAPSDAASGVVAARDSAPTRAPDGDA
jgi:dolichol-phosphate mannosyltransferase